MLVARRDDAGGLGPSVSRLDFGRLGKAKEIAAGQLEIPAYSTRVGIFKYLNADGSERKELRIDEEVFSQDSLASMRDAPLTRLHPMAPVTPETWRRDSIGHVSDPRADGEHVANRIIVSHAGAIKEIREAGLTELSCGYECQLQKAAGTWKGDSYDMIQRTIRYNHVALGPKDWGRAGPTVRLHTDKGEQDAAVSYSFPAIKADNREETIMKIKLFRVDGGKVLSVEVEKNSDQHVDHLEKGWSSTEPTRADVAASKPKTDEEEEEMSDEEKEKAKKGGNPFAKKTDAADEAARIKAEAIIKKDSDEKAERAFQARVDSRCALIVKASQVLGTEYKADGKKDLEIKIDLLHKLKPDYKCDGKTEAQLDAILEFVGDPTPAGTRVDGKDLPGVHNAPKGGKDQLAQARAKRNAHMDSLWQQPLAVSKDEKETA